MSAMRALLSGLLAMPLVASAASADYHLDPVHTRILFAVSHAGFSYALGTVSGSTGSLSFDPDDWSTAQVSVTVPMTRLDLGDPDWNRAVGAPSLLDVVRHPVATFVSGKVVPKDRDHASVCGTLTLRGVAQDTCLDVTFHQLKRHPMPPFRRTAGFSATATLSRKAFGIDAWPGVIGDEVQLRIEAEGVRGAEPQGAPVSNAPTVTAPAPAPSNDAPPTPPPDPAPTP